MSAWRVRIFTDKNLARLEKKINSFLDSIDAELLWVDIETNQSMTLREYIALVCYRLSE